MDAPLNFQMLTPERFRWVMDIGESTEAEWRARKAIAFFKQGRVIRYTPAAALEFIAARTKRARNAEGGMKNSELADALFGDARFARLIADQVRAQLDRAESGKLKTEMLKAA